MEFYLAGKVALVSGAASGIGRELVAQLTDSGAKVLAADINREGLDVLANAVGCETFVVDVGDPESNQGMVDSAVQRFGRLDLAFLNAAVLGVPIKEQGKPPSMQSLTIDRYLAARSVNLDGVLYGQPHSQSS